MCRGRGFRLAALAAQFGMNHLGICAIPDCRSAYVDPSPSRPGRYCIKHCASKANVTVLGNHRRWAGGYSTSTAVG